MNNIQDLRRSRVASREKQRKQIEEEKKLEEQKTKRKVENEGESLQELFVH